MFPCSQQLQGGGQGTQGQRDPAESQTCPFVAPLLWPKLPAVRMQAVYCVQLAFIARLLEPSDSQSCLPAAT